MDVVGMNQGLEHQKGGCLDQASPYYGGSRIRAFIGVRSSRSCYSSAMFRVSGRGNSEPPTVKRTSSKVHRFPTYGCTECSNSSKEQVLQISGVTTTRVRRDLEALRRIVVRPESYKQ